MQELVELDIPAVLLALLILGAVIAVVRVWILRSRKSSKAREEEFRRLQRLAAEEQARAEADWEEEYRRLKQSEVSRKNELRRRTTEGEGGVYWKKQHTAEFDDEAAAAPQQPRRAADVGSRIQAAAELEANLRKQQELEAAVNRKKQQEAELEEAVSRKKQELEALTREQAELESANRKKRAEEEEAARIKKQEELEAERRMQAEEEEAKRKRKEEADREARLQQQQAELEAANQKEDPREEAKPGNRAEEQANHTKSVPELQQQQQGEVLRKPPPEPKKKHMVGGGGGGRYFCAVCGKLTKRRCKQCKRVHYCSTECQLQHWIAGHKYECRGVDTGSPGSLDTDSRTFSEVPSPMSTRSENYKTFSDFTDMGSGVNELGASAAAAATSFRGPTHNSKLPSATVSDGRQYSTKPKKILFPYDQFVELFNWDILNVPPCGLINCGNSCFANVVLQCLNYTQPLTAYFLEGRHGESCTRRDWCFMCELQKHVQKVRASQRPFAPINILSRIQKIGSHLGYGRQEDAHEFMRFAIDLMQTICLDAAGGEKAVDVSIQETSLIYRIFGGCLQSQVKCMQCLHESNRYEPMMDLAVEIQGNVKSLEDALGQFTSTELLDGVNNCNSFVNAHKRLTVYEAPNILTVALKRFQGGKFGKLNKRVTFPEVLDMVPYMSGEGDKPPLYHLYAVVVHLDVSNASDSGHYICYIKNSLGHWYKIDDSKVKKVDLFEVTSQRAYMLFYARSSARPPRVTGDGTAADGRLAGGQQSNESGRGTVRVERQRSSLYSLKSSPQPMELIRSIPDDAGSNGSGWYRVGTSSIQQNWSSDSGLDAQKKFVNRDSSVPLSSGDAEITENGIALAAQGGRSKANSSKVISISNNSSVGFQSLSGNLEHCLSFRLSGQPWDVTDVVNQPLWSPPRKGLGKLVKQRLFKGLSLGFFLKRFEKHNNMTALVSGSDSCAQQPCPAFTCPKVCVDSCHACSLLDKHNQMQSPEEPDNVFKGLWEKFFPEETQHQLKDSSSSSVSGLVGPEFFQMFEESCSRHLEINDEAQKVQGGGIMMNVQNCMGVLSKVLPSGEVDFRCCSKSGFSHYFWTPGEQKNLNVFEDNNNAEVMTCGDFSLSSLARSSSIQGMFHPIQVR
ncbi:hypothetical protein CY35_04G059400 [Sphagnum magellanicum]|nr:hypothetical protein CY35_04G059400 [Sphagnum magellanicum]KAH9565093.1 hypothetical protein CY35_04G059400 [Sphagnum magellanicum]